MRLLCSIRLIVLLLISATAFYGFNQLHIEADYLSIAILLSVYALLTISTLYRLANDHPTTEAAFTRQLFSETLLISILVYLTGGATNPFISYLLVPISIAAAILPTQKTSLLALFAILCYSILLVFYQPMDIFSNNMHESHLTGQHSASQSIAFNAHYFGMWFNFVISACLISWFVAKMARAIRLQNQAINEQRESQLHDEQILAIATMAASTAHDIGTPLNTLKLLIDEFKQTLRPQLSASEKEDITLMQSQIEHCQNRLRKLVTIAQQTQPSEVVTVTVGSWLQACISQWQALRPEISVATHFDALASETVIRTDETLAQAIANLLNNAANAGTDSIEVSLASKPDSVNVVICNRGESIPDSVLDIKGKNPVKNHVKQKKAGLGLGIFLSNASINRLGGQLILKNLQNVSGEAAGAEVTISLPAVDQ